MTPLFFLSIFMWSLGGSDGDSYNYYLAETSEELMEHCFQEFGGCVNPNTNEMWVLQKDRYSKSNYLCLTVEDHELAHVIGYTHGMMADLCFWEKMKILELMYPTNNWYHLEQMALR